MVEKRIDIFVRFRENFRQFTGALGMPIQQFKKLQDSSGRVDKNLTKNVSTFGKMGLGIRRLTHGFRGFKMEMLGVMFFGMGIQRFFMGLLKPAMQMAGIFDLLNVILGVLFLPIILALLDPLLRLGDWLMNLSDSTKLMIGKIVIFGAALGTALFFVGMFALGIGSLILALSGVFMWISNLLGPVGNLSAGMFLIGGASSVIGPIWNSMKSIIGKVWDKFLEIPAIQDLITDLGIDIEDLKHPWKFIREKAEEFFDWLEEKTGIDVTTDIENLKTTFEGFATSMGEISTALTGTIVPALEDFYKIMKKIMGLPAWIQRKMFGLTEGIRPDVFIPPPTGPTPGGVIHSADFTISPTINITGAPIEERGIIEGTIAEKIADYVSTVLPDMIRRIVGGEE